VPLAVNTHFQNYAFHHSGDHPMSAIIGESPQIRKVIATAQKIARTPTVTVLITGESGTGKEVVARLVHDSASPALRPFIDVNCGAIPENLLESELFGHERGAFTDARARKQGLFELANGGTIFLDEIGNITLNLQMKLLKAVENKVFRRIGGVDEIQVSTRIVAATNFNLQEAVRQGRFREDLFYRLNICHIELPPLRERAEDGLLLAEHFIREFNEQYNLSIKGLTPAARNAILAYRWPGNVRQLRNCIERAMLVESEEYIDAADLGEEIAANQAALTTGNGGAPSFHPDEMPVQEVPIRFDLPDEGLALETLERQIILSALQRAGGNVSKASRLLHIQRGKLRYRIERLGLGNELVAIATARQSSSKSTRRRKNPKPMDAIHE
jgi:transcriptional regulator with PAS, ATPase and Fis domain